MWPALLICMAFLTFFLVYKSRSSTRQGLKFAALLSSVATLILCLVSALSNPEQKEEDQREAVFRRAVAMKFVASLPPSAKPWKILDDTSGLFPLSLPPRLDQALRRRACHRFQLS